MLISYRYYAIIDGIDVLLPPQSGSNAQSCFPPAIKTTPEERFPPASL